MGRLLKAACVATVSIGALGALSTSAGAAAPRTHACIGKSFSALATTQQNPGDFGQGVRSFAQQPNTAHPGLGDGLQALKAGGVDDSIVPNTCNN
jgi:hypothetical protein